MEENKVALVTEAGNGLGKALANLLLNYNYKVVLAASGKSYDRLSEEGSSIRGYELVETDFTSGERLSALKHQLKSSFGKLDLLVNNAEIVNGFGHKIDHLKIEEIKELYEVNFFAVIKIIQLMKPLLEQSEEPRIINVTSALGDINKMKDKEFCYYDYSLTAYATSKAALNMYTHLQCKEFIPSKISIHSFDPVALKNCTHNSVMICDEIKDEFIALIR